VLGIRCRLSFLYGQSGTIAAGVDCVDLNDRFEGLDRTGRRDAHAFAGFSNTDARMCRRYGGSIRF
jgi:hypothetical protein